MTPHLTDEQLGAARDRALSGAAAAAAERHLAECDACRARLVELDALDAGLADALGHDPGEAYFASFADRVGARIAAAAPARAPRRGFAAWWGAPVRLAWAGGALALVAVAALVVTLAREHGPAELAAGTARRSEVGVSAAPGAAAAPPAAEEAPRAADERAAAPAAPPAAKKQAEASAPAGAEPPAPRTFAAAPPTASAPSAHDERDRPRTDAAAPGRLQHVRDLPGGEVQVLGPARERASAPLVPQANGLARRGAEALAARPLAAATSADAAPAPPPAVAGTSASAPAVTMKTSANAAPAGANAVCGEVRDPAGQPVAHALVVVLESGATASTGAQGAFCIDVPAGGGTLSVLAVGYQPARERVGAPPVAALAALVVRPADVLGALAPKGVAGGAAGMLATGAGHAPRPSVLRAAAIAASDSALVAGSVAAWTKAAGLWESVARVEPASGGAEPAYRAAEARVNAWLVGRGDAAHEPALHDAARRATQAYLGLAPAGTSRDVALGWARVLGH